MFKKIVWLWFSTTWKNAREVESYIDALVAWGATEFFTGYNPNYWSEKFGYEVSPNGRFSEHEQITDLETLREIVKCVHKHWLEIFINLNAWYYTDVTFPYIQKMVSEFLEVGVDGIICGNITILEYLKEINYAGKINISTILALYNSESIRFFLENYKINKVILSREVTLKEIEKIVTSFPATKFEVFGEGDFCRYNNGLCYAEHKYGERDICTVVVNDLVFKKKFRADFKKIILDSNISDLEKIWFFDERFQDVFEKIGDILSNIELGFGEKVFLTEELQKIYKITQNRVDLFFDALESPNSEKNKKILTYFKGLKYLSVEWISDFDTLKNELEQSIQSGMKSFFERVKTIGEPKLKALETNLFYAKGDSLNLYSYVFFSKFPNIETVKFPTRWRNYNEKLKLIEEVVMQKKDPKEYLERIISPERTHYDLTHLFGEKLWFRKMIGEMG